MKKMYLLSLLLFACQAVLEKKSNPPVLDLQDQTPVSVWDDNLKGFLALGDSYTIGEAVAENMRWPNQLVEKWNANEPAYNPAEIIARTGWTTDELSNALDQTPPKRSSYDKVSLLIGVNNQYRGRSSVAFEEELIELIERAIVYAGNDPSRVFLVSIPDWGVMPFAEGRDREEIALQIDAFNAVVRRQALAFEIDFIDVTPISREATNNSRLVASDGLHPSGYQYTLWANTIFNALKNN